MKQLKMFLKIMVTALLFLCYQANAQQTRVDSVIQLLNKSIINNKLDTVTFYNALEILQTTTLTDGQIEQLETVAQQVKKWEKDMWPFYIQLRICSSLINVDADRAINYGKLQIEKLDKLNSPEASNLKSDFLNTLRFPFRNTNRFEEGFQYYTQKLNDYKTSNDSLCISQCYYVLSGFYRISGIMDQAIYNMKKSCSYIDTLKNKGFWANNMGVIGYTYLAKGDKTECLRYNGIALRERRRAKLGYSFAALNIARMMLLNNELDSAAYYIKIAKEDTIDSRNSEIVSSLLQTEALYKIQSGALDEAEALLKKCWQLINENNIAVNAAPGTIAPDYYLALVRIKQNKFDEAIALLTRDIERLKKNRLDIMRDYKLIANLYKKTGKNDRAAETYAIFIAKQDSLLVDQDKFRSYSFEAEQLMSEKELSIAKLESQNKISSLYRNFSIGLAALLLLIAAGIYNRFYTKKKANLILEKTLIDLKSTQSQLIQSEKMASLGELTAGIAHEIQNPLNFVNNFSEVNAELIDELQDELAIGNMQLAKEISGNIKENEEKIIFHGKRADAIVKGMLMHSRNSSGVKEPTDINALADEYLRLAYHGLRAKDKSFNATMKTEFDESIGLINIVPQDIGRVILNLITNAFYAVCPPPPEGGTKKSQPGFEPTVWVTTKKEGNKIYISIQDNGSGIPQKVLDKIFQPFFTTKPTGQGTGLGLSLSYDIVKAHGGEIKIETKENEGTTFTIHLPTA